MHFECLKLLRNSNGESQGGVSCHFSEYVQRRKPWFSNSRRAADVRRAQSAIAAAAERQMIEPAADVTGVDAVDTVAQSFACPKCADESAASSDCFAELGVFFKAVDRELEKRSQFTASHRTSVRHKSELRPANTCTRCCSLQSCLVPWSPMNRMHYSWALMDTQTTQGSSRQLLRPYSG